MSNFDNSGGIIAIYWQGFPIFCNVGYHPNNPGTVTSASKYHPDLNQLLKPPKKFYFWNLAEAFFISASLSFIFPVIVPANIQEKGENAKHQSSSKYSTLCKYQISDIKQVRWKHLNYLPMAEISTGANVKIVNIIFPNRNGSTNRGCCWPLDFN